MSTPEDINQMLADCDARESKLSDLEREFLDDVGMQLRRGKALTENQDNKLTQIWERVT